MLVGWLDFHRQTLLWKCSGLTAAQLRLRAVEPSSLSLLGLVRHMSEVERSWFRHRVAGEDVELPESAQLAESLAPSVTWSEPLAVPLPLAANLTITVQLEPAAVGLGDRGHDREPEAGAVV